MDQEIRSMLGRLMSLESCQTINPTNIANWTTWGNLWRGCYDVWMCDQDRTDAIEMPKKIMQEAMDRGFIFKEVVQHRTRMVDVYRMTKLAAQFLDAHDD